MSWGLALAEGLKVLNTFVVSKTKSAKEKLEDMRLDSLKEWLKFKKKAKKNQIKRHHEIRNIDNDPMD